MKADKVLKYSTIGSAAAVILMMAAATVIERLYGTDRALNIVYHSPVFITLWAVAAISGVWMLIRRGTIRKPATFFLHIAFVLILAGALISMLTGKSGIMELRRGLVTNQWASDKGFSQKLPFSLQLKEFKVEYYPGTHDPSDYMSKVVLKDTRNDS